MNMQTKDGIAKVGDTIKYDDIEYKVIGTSWEVAYLKSDATGIVNYSNIQEFEIIKKGIANEAED